MSVEVDARELDLLAADLVKGKRHLLGRLAERGYVLLRRDIKDNAYETGNLLQGVASPDVDYERMQAMLTVSARSGATGSRVGEVFDKKGKPTGRKVSLRPSPAFNYAEAVAKGRPSISPRKAKALLIPVPTAPTGESYLLVGGQTFILRRSAAAVKPNPFDERVASRLESEAVPIATEVLNEFV